MSSFFITRKDGSRHEVLVDADDLERVLAAGPWRIFVPNACRIVYVVSGQGKAHQYLHRFLMEPGAGVQVDHINGDGLDNRRGNLRLCSAAQNGGNVARQKNNTSGFKGVHFHKKAGRWMAQIKVRGKYVYLGLHDTPEQAHEAYQRAAVQYFGEFAHFG